MKTKLPLLLTFSLLAPSVSPLLAQNDAPAPPAAATGPFASPSLDAAALQSRIDALERENQTLRMQWGQTTMELDRLRRELTDAHRQLAEAQAQAEPRRLSTPAPAPTPGPNTGTAASAAVSPTPPAPPVQFEGPSPSPDSALQAELARLRRENEDLRTEKTELTTLAGVTAEGEAVASQDARITSAFDPAAGRTVVRTAPQRVRMRSGSAADTYLSVVYTFAGKDLSGTTPDVTGHLQARNAGGAYAGADTIDFTLDGERASAPITDHRVNQKQTGIAGKRRINKDDEFVTFDVSEDLLRRLARAVRAEARVGNVTFTLSRDDLAMFKAVQRRIEKGI